MRCIATSFGSAGDFLPTLAVGAALRRRGHQVWFVANPFYESRVRHAGLDLIPAGEEYDLYERIEKTPAYGDPANVGMLFRDLAGPNAAATYRVIGERLRSEQVDVVVASDVSFGSFWAAAEQRVPSVLVHATPTIWMSGQAPVVLGDRALPAWLSRPLTIGARAVMNWYLTRLLRPLARELGTSVGDVSFATTERLAAIQLALWSPLLRGRVASDPPNGTICGFTRSSAFGGAQPGIPPEVEAFLRAGPPPVVVGLGSVFALNAGSVLTNIAEACAEDGHRCLVIGHPTGAQFPPNTLAVRYAPYDQVFPRGAAVIVHGGAGTTGEALRCGKPIIGVPFAFDQVAQCAAMEQLGVGVRVPLAKRTRGDFSRALRHVLSDEAIRQRAIDSGRQFAAERDGAESGADAIERLVTSTTAG